MKNDVIDVERRTNVIPLSFKDRRSSTEQQVVIPNEISHPASLRYPVDDDPLSQILDSYDDFELDSEFDLDEDDEPTQKEDFIFHRKTMKECKVSIEDSPSLMADTVLEQIRIIKEDSRRIKYYLDELNLDK